MLYMNITCVCAGEEVGQKNYAQPYLAPNTTGSAILNGVNYASGGGGIMNATGSIFVSMKFFKLHVVWSICFLFII